MRVNFFLVAVLIPALCLGQMFDGICFYTTNVGVKITEMQFAVYANNTFINERYQNINEVTNSTPEALLKSLFSAKDNEWQSLNHGKPMNWTQEQFSRLNSPDNRIELLCRLDLKLDSLLFSIFKVNLHEQNNQVSISLSMQKTSDGSWIIVENQILSNIEFIMMFVSVDDLYYMFTNSLNSDNQAVNRIIQSNWSSGIFDFTQIINDFGGLLLSSEYQRFPMERSVKFIEKNIWNVPTNSIISYSNQRFCYFFENENTSFSESIVVKVIDLVKQEKTNSEIFPLAMLTYVDIHGNDIVFFKYRAKTNDIVSIENIALKNNIKTIISNNISYVFEREIEYIKHYFGIQTH